MTISSENKTILVLSDVHQDINRLNKILAGRPFDVCCILGDFFDSFVYNQDADFLKTCDFVLDRLDDKRFRFLLGNHDQQYIYKNRYTYCSGLTQNKFDLFDKKFKGKQKQIQDKFEWFFRIDEKLSTHAGLHPSYINASVSNLGSSLDEFLTNESAKASFSIKNQEYFWMYGVGRARRGFSDFSGINWLDFNVEHEKISGLDQIFGHTHGTRIVDKDGDLCIDCDLIEWIEICNGETKIKSYYDL